MEEAKWRWRKITFNNAIERIPLKLVSTAAAASAGIADGRLIPVLLVDTSSRSDIDDLIKVHKYIAPGDVTITWGQFSGKQNSINLILSFERPVKCTAILEFDILKDGGIVDQIVLSEALYLQSAKEGERLLSTLDRERLLVEVPSKHFQPRWNDMLLKALESDGKRKGMSKKQAREYSSGVIREWRKFGEMRKQG